ncbi:hypothetical protein [Alistipes sp.]|uniref:hypothetical protein n=1 Tax=Alistipes sp. TaxID=1872444 RepID=UPI003AF19D24
MLVLCGAVGIFALVAALLALRRDLGNGRAWKRAEPAVCRAIAEVTGQAVEHRMMLNGSMSDDFSPRSVFWLFVAFTRDCIVLVQRDWEDDGGDTAPQRLGARREARLRRTGKRFAQLTLPAEEGGEPLTVWLCVAGRQFEELARRVPLAREW